MARTNSTMPKPPNHCVMLRHRSTDEGRCSTAGRMVAPVEATPDMDSKKASVKVRTVPVARNGSVPKRAKTTHRSTTRRNAIRRSDRVRALRNDTSNSNPTLKVKRPEAVTAGQVPSPKCNAGIRQESISTPSTISRIPMTRRIYFIQLLLQYDGEKTATRAKISSRPASMRTTRVSFPTTGRRE